MTDQLDEIKRRIDIVEFIGGYVSLTKAGRNFRALCPFHAEDSPSFIVSPERQIWHCFGACGEGGDIFKFFTKIENVEFSEAVRELAQRAGVTLTRYQPAPGEGKKQILYEINHLAAEYYHYLLMSHPAGKSALDYILGRGISKESLELFKLGFAPESWDSLQKYLVAKKGYREGDLEDAGLIISSSSSVSSARYYDRFRNRLMFPLKDHRGNICGFAGRILTPDVKQAKYVNTSETLIYHKSSLLFGLFEAKNEIKKADEVVIVEGELDMISSYQAGIKNVVAIKGSALTPDQVHLLSRFTKNIVLSLDKDAAGNEASKKGIEVADLAGMAIKAVELTGGKDPDEVAQKDPQLWQKLVKEAVPVYDFLFDLAFSKVNLQTADGKRKAADEIVPVLAKIANEIVRDHYIARLSSSLMVDREAVIARINKTVPTTTIVKTTKTAEKLPEEERSRREMLEKHLFSLAFQSGRWELLLTKKIPMLVTTPVLSRIIVVLAEYLEKYRKYKSERLAGMLPGELVDTYNNLYLSDFGSLAEDSQNIENEFAKTLSLLREINLREKLNSLSQEIKMLEGKPEIPKEEQDRLGSLYIRFQILTNRLSTVILKRDKI